MSRFYGSMMGSRGEATRCGTAASGLTGHVRGWAVGVRVEASSTEDGDGDEFRIYATGGSNARCSDVYLGRVVLDGGVKFQPSGADNDLVSRVMKTLAAVGGGV